MSVQPRLSTSRHRRERSLVKINATHVLLSLVLVALLLNAFLVLRPTPAQAAMADDLSNVEGYLRDMNYKLDSVSRSLDGIKSELAPLDSVSSSLSKIADSDIWDLRQTSQGNVTQGLPIVTGTP
jgi:hypothetical protein